MFSYFWMLLDPARQEPRRHLFVKTEPLDQSPPWRRHRSSRSSRSRPAGVICDRLLFPNAAPGAGRFANIHPMNGPNSMVLVYLTTSQRVVLFGQMLVNIPAPWSIWDWKWPHYPIDGWYSGMEYFWSIYTSIFWILFNVWCFPDMDLSQSLDGLVQMGGTPFVETPIFVCT